MNQQKGRRNSAEVVADSSSYCFQPYCLGAFPSEIEPKTRIFESLETELTPIPGCIC